MWGLIKTFFIPELADLTEKINNAASVALDLHATVDDEVPRLRSLISMLHDDLTNTKLQVKTQLDQMRDELEPFTGQQDRLSAYLDPDSLISIKPHSRDK